jgi:hypothetical protein
MAEMRAPVTRGRGGTYVLHLGPEERALVRDLLGELRAMITDPDPPPALVRLFPVVYPDHAENEAEYQRLMRDELVASKIEGIESVDAVLGRSGRKVHFDEAELLAFMQAVNSVRLVLGTMLDVTDDEPVGGGTDEEQTPEHYLYDYLSWVLDSAVRAMSGA